MQTQADAVVIGAGPIGMTLALLLAKRGHSVVLVEQRREHVLPDIKANHISARSMELFRRLGLSKQIRSVGLPQDFPHDVAFRTSFTGAEFGRIRIPSVANRFTDASGPDGSWRTAEPSHRVNQIYLEPVLRDAVAASTRIRTIYATRVASITQDEDGVTATAKSLLTGEELSIRGAYAIGCEGGSSLTRHTIGANFQGDAVIQRTKSTYIDCPTLLKELNVAPAWTTLSFNGERCGTVYAIDGVRHWLVHNYVSDDEAFEDVDHEAGLRAILGLSTLESVEVIYTQDWTGRRMLAERFRSGRLFLCGDSAHIWAPWAGYGMNAGLADAESLAWCISGVLEGWGGPELLDAYEAERRPVTEEMSNMIKAKASVVAGDRRAIPADLATSGPAGDVARKEFGERVYQHNLEQFCAAGLNFGYSYSNSPIIEFDGAEPPPYVMGAYEDSAVPGARFPHCWMDESETRSLYDELGEGFALLSAGSAYTGEVQACAERLAVPIAVVNLPSRVRDEEWCEHELYLVRADGHVVWRASGEPQDVEQVLLKVSGRA